MRASSLAVALAAFTSVSAQTAHKSGGKEHIVLFNKNHPIPPAVEDVLERLELNTSHPDVKRIYNNSAFVGFSAEMLPHCLDLLANMSDVSIVEETVAVTSNRAIPVERRQTPFHFDTRASAPWGLQRISTTSKLSGNPDVLDFTYSFANSDLGTGADIMVIDTGLYAEHVVFGGRAKQIWSADGKDIITDGHGTHVAGTAGGESLGVASKANILGLQALTSDGSGNTGTVIAAIDRAVQHHEQRRAQASTNGHRGSVINMSLAAGGVVSAMSQALNAATEAGIHVVVAAGNEGEDACNGSPSSSGGTHGPAIAVGSVNIQGKRSSFSNYGECVDVYAPGEDIVSAWIGAPNMVNVEAGTSMASPHVAGIVAYAMANQTLADSPALMKEWIVMQGIPQADGTVIANNGVATASTTHTLSTSAKQSAAGWQKSKRALGSDGLSSVVGWFTKIFGKKHHHRRSAAAEDTNKMTFRFSSESLTARSSDYSSININIIEKRAIGEGFNSLVNWFTGLFHGKKHPQRDAVAEKEGFGPFWKWIKGGLQKGGHKTQDAINKQIPKIGSLLVGRGTAVDPDGHGTKDFWHRVKNGFKTAWDKFKGLFH